MAENLRDIVCRAQAGDLASFASRLVRDKLQSYL